MRTNLTTPLRALPALLLFALSTLLHVSVLLLAAVLKLLTPWAGGRRRWSAGLAALAESWIGVNSALIRWFTPARIEVEGGDGLRRDGWYLVVANHQSWVDIPILQAAFNRRMPLFRFFLKRQLIWVPLLGLAWWALDFPFMRRSSRAQLERNPQLRGRDKAATRRACERFRQLPVAVMNFVEGTRFTAAKHAAQQAPFRHLLKPRGGGVGYVLEAMGDLLQTLVDVTVIYPQGRPTLLDLLAGRLRQVRVIVRVHPIPAEFAGRDYDADHDFRTRVQAWLNTLWQDKDATIEAALGALRAPA